MLNHNEYSDYVLKMLNDIPQKYDDRDKEIIYRYGLLVGIIAKLMHEDSLVVHSFKDTVNKIINR
jgi:hypothetical protein